MQPDNFAKPPRRARLRTVYLMFLGSIAIFLAITGGMCYLFARDSGLGASFKEAYRVPEYVPDWLGRSSGGVLWDALWEKRGLELPYVVLRWEYCHANEGGVMLGIATGDSDVKLGGRSRSAVEVDDVQGWLTHLSPEDFVPPPRNSEEYERLTEGWDYDRSVYERLLWSRSDEMSSIGGHAIALQWNKGGFHYILAARVNEQMTADVLLRMANNMTPAPFPTYPELTRGIGEDRCPR